MGETKAPQKNHLPSQTEREPGIDLVRVTALFFVVGVHHFYYNGFYFEPQNGALMWAADTFRWLFFCCNGIFMVLTGYLKSVKPFTTAYYKGLIPVLVSYLLCCCITFPIQNQLITEKLSIWEWLKKIYTFGNYAWYVEMYIGLVLISPIINLALQQITDHKLLVLLAVVMFCISALPSVTALNLVPDYWTAVYPLTYYVIGAVIRRLQPRVKTYAGLGMALVISMGLALTSILTTDQKLSTGFTQGYGGCWTTLVAVCVFLGLYRVKPGERVSKLLAWMAGGVFEGYLLSILADLFLYSRMPQWHTPEKYPILFLCATIPVFLFAVLAGKAVHSLSGKLLSLLPGFHRETQKV